MFVTQFKTAYMYKQKIFPYHHTIWDLASESVSYNLFLTWMFNKQLPITKVNVRWYRMAV